MFMVSTRKGAAAANSRVALPVRQAATSATRGDMYRTAHAGVSRPETPRRFFEPRFGYDFTRVHVREGTGTALATNARALSSVGGSPLQTKLRVNEPGDQFEREADSVAESVVRWERPPVAQAVIHPTAFAPVLQSKCVCDGNCHGCNGKLEGPLQRAPTESGATSEAPPIVEDVLRSSGRPMDVGTRALLEPRFGQDFSGVRIHADDRAARSAEAVHARAYTVGRDVVFGAGEYSPQTSSGLRLLAHELTHVAQQSSGMARRSLLQRTTHGPSTPTNCHNWTIPLPPWIAGSIAHAQISSTLGILPGTIPRATKLLMGVPNPPAFTPFGFADLWKVIGPEVNTGEIKSTATGSGVAATEVVHYLLRHTQSLGRIAAGTGDARDATYLAAMGGAPLPGAPLDLSSITGTDLPLGVFTGDPGKILHVEADRAGAMVYWCTGAGVPGPLSWVALKKALDELKKKLDGAKQVVREAAARAADGLVAFGRALPSILRVLFVILLILLVLACVIVAVVCALGIPVTLGGSSLCSAAAIGGALGATTAILLIIGVSAPRLPEATASVVRAANPVSAQGEAESGADYERDADNPSAPITTASAAAARAAYDPQAVFMAALAPISNLLDSPISSARTVASNLGSLPIDAGSQLYSAAGALVAAGDSATATFIRQIITDSGMNNPGALAAVSADGMSDALARIDLAPGAESAAPTGGAPTAAPVDSAV